MDLTTISKNIGQFIAKLKCNNELLEQMQKNYNPTFLEILDDAQQYDPTLASLLVIWYSNKYGIDASKLDKTENSLRAALKGEDTKIINKFIHDDAYNYSCGSTKKSSSASCSFNDDAYDYSCGPYGYRSHYDDRC